MLVLKYIDEGRIAQDKHRRTTRHKSAAPRSHAQQSAARTRESCAVRRSLREHSQAKPLRRDEKRDGARTRGNERERGRERTGLTTLPPKKREP